ncbi:protein of unknown function [Cyanobium sp. NIES-981]|nr:protein of unknown function [Cyanobium sp. NIES-981]
MSLKSFHIPRYSVVELHSIGIFKQGLPRQRGEVGSYLGHETKMLSLGKILVIKL